MKKITLLLLLAISATALSQSNSFEWAKSFAHNNTKRSSNSAIAVDTAGNVYSTGYFQGTVDFDPGAGVFTLTSLNYNMYVTKLDASGNFVWAKAIPGNNDLFGERITLDKWANIYVSARVPKDSYGTVMLMKLNNDGDILWTKDFKTPHDTINGFSSAYSLKADSLGNVYVTGNFRGTIDFDPGPDSMKLSTSNIQDFDIFISKLDSAGNYVFVKQIGGDQTEIAIEIALDSANIYITGSFGGTVDFDPGVGSMNLTSKYSDVFISKFTLSGDFVWAKSLVSSTSSYSQATSISLDPAGNIYATGIISGAGTIDFDPGPGTWNVNYTGTTEYTYLLKLANNGGFAWVKPLITDPSSNANASYSCVRNGKDGGIYLSGSFSGSEVDLDPGPAIFGVKLSNNFLLKLDALGDFITAKPLVSESMATIADIEVDESENVYSSGSFFGQGDFDPSEKKYHIFQLGENQNAFIQKLKACQPVSTTLNLQKCFSYTLNDETYTKNGIYRQIHSSASGCDSVVTINLTLVNPAQPICLVTVDNKSSHNIVVWEKQITPQIDSFRIFRETNTDVYTQIASVPYDSLSEYHDYDVDPNATSYKYKMQLINKCGEGGDTSGYHNTIHLQNLGNGNFQWTVYGIEKKSNPVVNYRMYRDDNNTGNFQPISSTIPGGNSTFTDVNYNTYANANYYLDVKWNVICTPTRSVNTSRSNVIRKVITTVPHEDQLMEFDIYPNPASETVIVKLTSVNQSGNLRILNILGETVLYEKLINSSQTIKVSQLAKGVYNVQLESGGTRINRKLIIN